MALDYKVVRSALADLPRAGAHMAAEPPEPNEIFAPASHDSALDPDRALVVGNRGVGKSFWSSVLADEKARRYVAGRYRHLGLEKATVVLGFHESAEAHSGFAPSPRVLRALVDQKKPGDVIWQAVLLRALGSSSGLSIPPRLPDVVSWIENHIEDYEEGVRRADRLFSRNGGRFVLLFDALDRVAIDWATIRQLTGGLLRLALNLRGFRGLRVKIFMRSDQASDDSLFRFADASKLRAEKVELTWRRRDLYGLLYNWLWRHPKARAQLAMLFRRADVSLGSDKRELPQTLSDREEDQAAVFYYIAGEFMGSDPRRGRTYSWFHDHLADAFGETSPRSFLVALQRAAQHDPAPIDSAIDHHGLRAGVQEASGVRLDQLKEDYDWIDQAIRPLEGLEVPCPPHTFITRWKERRTVHTLRALSKKGSLGPLELEDAGAVPEERLLLALQHIGVVEERSESRINMPDIFRVAAKMKRRGGVRPPVPAGRR